MNPKTLIISLLVIIFLLGGGAWFLSKSPANQSKEYTQFAQCLAQKKLTMYGAEWCSHCQNEKKLFGSAWQYVPYVECPANPQVCLENGVSGYPTWIDSTGNKYEGEQGLEGLSRISGCQLP
ncbi:MAG: thioredoxin domain-containing protein [bacterium]|nr:thioredoxin domain-containing protein [bacterium]